MCIILPVSHIPCAHTISIWQYCIDATRSGVNGITPCWNARQHERAILSRSHCENCGGARLFARRGGVAERGNGSRPAVPKEHKLIEQDETDDSGYHSDVIREEEETSENDEVALSPRATQPPKLQFTHRHARKRRPSSASVTSKPNWKPNLKRDFGHENVAKGRAQQDSMNSMMSKFDRSTWLESSTQTIATHDNGDKTASTMDLRHFTSIERRPKPPKRRESTLLHPSSPPLESPSIMQHAKAFTFPQMVCAQQPTPEKKTSIASRKQSTLLHPSSPLLEAPPEPLRSRTEPFDFPLARPARPQRPAGPDRTFSTLLHPSCPNPTHPSDLNGQDPHHAALVAQSRTILSIPPQKQHQDTPRTERTSTLLHPSPPSLLQRRCPNTPERRLPSLLRLAATPDGMAKGSERVAPRVRVRRESVLHSCCSDVEDEGFDGRGEGGREVGGRSETKLGYGGEGGEVGGRQYGYVYGDVHEVPTRITESDIEEFSDSEEQDGKESVVLVRSGMRAKMKMSRGAWA